MSRYPRLFYHAMVVAMVVSLCTVAAGPPPVARAAGEFKVNTTLDLDGFQCPDPDTGLCSLRQAINAANEAGDAVVTFSIPGTDPGFESNGVIRTWRITLDAALGGLPALQNGTDIDGWTQESAVPGTFNPIGPDIIIDGRNLMNRSGITINSPDAVSEVKGLAIVNFKGSGGFGQGVGINVVSGSGHIIQGNFIGVDQQNIASGQAGGNGFAGIWVQAAASNVLIGGQNINQRESNIISNNDLDGIVLQGNNNIVRGNFIGTDYGANNDLPNHGAGILVYSSTGNIIGPGDGQNSTYGNFISGNRDYGIQIDGGQNTEIAGNYIGLGLNASSVVRSAPNGAGGVEVNSDTRAATGNAIGVAGRPRNFISGNNGPGIRLRSSSTSDTSIVNNVIGLDTAGFPMSSPNNVGGGIVVTGGVRNVTIGGPTIDDSNIISANDGDGIFIEAPSSSARSTNNTIIGNCIGVGTACAIIRPIPSPWTAQDWGNSRAGIVIGNWVERTTIGGEGDSQNIIGFNATYGVAITGTQVLDTTFAGNKIRFNGSDGVLVAGARNTQILGPNTTVSADQAEISDNDGNGVTFQNAPISRIEFVKIEQNGQNGIAATNSPTMTLHSLWVVHNDQNGIAATNSPTMTVQSLSVRGNGADGIALSGTLRDVTIADNTVVTNTLGGIRIGGQATDTTITGNQVYTNTDAGITLQNTSGTLLEGNQVRGNLVGLAVTDGVDTTVSSNIFERNRQHGLVITNTALLTVTMTRLSHNGGSGALILASSQRVTIERTEVFSNTINGIQLGDGTAGPFPQRVQISSNRITGNGIPLDPDGNPITPIPQGQGIVFAVEGPPESSSNPNHDIDPPIDLALTSSGQLTGRVDVTSGAPQACLPANQCRIQVFRANPITRDGQGWEPISSDVAVSASGHFTASLSSIPTQLVVTATDGNGNTSRFAPFTASASLDIGPARSATAAPGEVITYTHRVTNTGNLALTNLQLSASSSSGWTSVTLNPSGPFTLQPNESRLVTVTVQLPLGPADSVSAGKIDNLTVAVQTSYTGDGFTQHTVRAQVVDVTTVAPKVVLSITPTTLSGRGAPGSQLPYVHTIRNNGNIAATFTLAGSTDLGPAWVTEVLSGELTLPPTQTITLKPGKEVTVTLLVTVPQLGTGVQEGTVARSRLRITTTNPVDPSQNQEVTDTTTVSLVMQASMVADQEVDGAAGVVTTIPHRVENLSNGQATFRLGYSSSLGSTVTFRSATNGVPLNVTNNSFTLGTQPDGSPPSEFDFFADVHVHPSLLPGQRESIIIFLLDAEGNVIGNAFVRDTINVTRGTVAPRIYLPLTMR